MDEYILLLDNEYENISDLEEVINDAINKISDGFYRETHIEPDSKSAVDYLKYLKDKNKKISAVIADEHLYEGIDGSDFLRFCRGYLPYLCTNEERCININWDRLGNFSLLRKICEKRSSWFDRQYIEFAEENFETPKEYGDFVKYFLDSDPLIVMLCGHPSGINTFGIEDVPIIQKCDGCELKVLEILENEGILAPEEVEPVLNNHYRLADPTNLKRFKYNPNSKRIKKKKKYLK